MPEQEEALRRDGLCPDKEMLNEVEILKQVRGNPLFNQVRLHVTARSLSAATELSSQMEIMYM